MDNVLDNGHFEHLTIVMRIASEERNVRRDTLTIPLRCGHLAIHPIANSCFGFSEGGISRALENSREGENLERHRTAKFGASFRDGHRTLWAVMHTTGCQVCKEGLGATV